MHLLEKIKKSYKTLKTPNLSFTAPAAKTLKTIHVKKGCCRQCWPTVERTHPDCTGCLQKAGPILPVIPPKHVAHRFSSEFLLHNSLLGSSVGYYRPIVKPKILLKPLFLCVGDRKKCLTDKDLQRFRPLEPRRIFLGQLIPRIIRKSQFDM